MWAYVPLQADTYIDRDFRLQNNAFDIDRIEEWKRKI